MPWSKSSLGGGGFQGLPDHAGKAFALYVELNLKMLRRCFVLMKRPNVFRTKKSRLTLHPRTGEKMMTDFYLIVGELLTQI